jgi:hypothetical protein
MVYIFFPSTNSFGVNVIIDKFVEICLSENISCKYINNLDGIKTSEMVIPYGIDCAIELINKGYKTEVCFMVDAVTLGYLNKIKFYLRNKMVFQYDFFRSIYVYLDDMHKVRKVLKHYERIMLVSQTDIDYLKRISPQNTKFLCVPNGVQLVECSPKTESNKLRLGILSSWNEKVSFIENDWFIRKIYKKFFAEHPDTVLYIAGRGVYGEIYKNMPGIQYMGEVEDLNDFFKNIDIFIAANPKGCGILNRTLDSFRYKTIVLGYEQSFSGFTYMKESYLSFKDYNSFENRIAFIQGNPNDVDHIIDNAYIAILNYNNWQKNYLDLISKLQIQ